MRRSILFILLTLWVLPAAIAPQTTYAQTVIVDHQRIAREVLEKHIRPAYADLFKAFKALENQTATYCKSPDADGLKQVQSEFANAITAWGRIAHITFGPIREENRYERIWFWPDRKGIARRQLANAIRNQPEGYQNAETLGKQSIAVQGLGAFERIAFGNEITALHDGTTNSLFLCDYLRAITANLSELAADTASGWNDKNFDSVWLHPGPENPSYLSDQETTFALFQEFMTAAERIRDVELARPLGLTAKRRIMSGPFKRSKLTMVFVAARIAGLRSLFANSGFSAELLRAAEGAEDPRAEAAIKQVLFELRLSDKRARELAEIPDLLGASPQRSKAIALGFPLKSMQQMAANAVGQLTKLPVGFNASDGD